MNNITLRGQALASKFSSMFGRGNNVSTTNPASSFHHTRQHRFSRLLSTMALTILLFLAVPALALKSYSYSFIESNVEMGFYLVNDGSQRADQGEALVAALPLNLFRVPEKLFLVVAMLNVLLSMAHLAFISWDWKAGKRTRTHTFRRNALVLYTINAILVLITLVAMALSHKASSRFEVDMIPKDPNAVSISGYRYFRYDSGTFDLETWTCELQTLKSVGDARKDYHAQCELEVAGRMIMVPFFLVTLAMVGLSVWALVATGGERDPHNEQMYAKDIELEVGKGPETGKEARVNEVELAVLPRHERQQDGRLSKIEEDGEEGEGPTNRISTTVTGVKGVDAIPVENVDVKKMEGGS